MRVMMLSKVYITSAFGHNILIVLINKPDLLQTCKIAPAMEYTIHDFMLMCNNYNSRCTWNMLSTANKKFKQPPIDSTLQIVDKFQNPHVTHQWWTDGVFTNHLSSLFQPFLSCFCKLTYPKGRIAFQRTTSVSKTALHSPNCQVAVSSSVRIPKDVP
jgi:hypothetical protein